MNYKQFESCCEFVEKGFISQFTIDINKLLDEGDCVSFIDCANSKALTLRFYGTDSVVICKEIN